MFPLCGDIHLQPQNELYVFYPWFIVNNNKINYLYNVSKNNFFFAFYAYTYSNLNTRITLKLVYRIKIIIYGN